VFSKVSPPMPIVLRPLGMGYVLWYSMQGRVGLIFADPQVRSRGQVARACPSVAACAVLGTKCDVLVGCRTIADIGAHGAIE
jgi:hypothetical protein